MKFQFIPVVQERFKNRLGRITENQLEEIIAGVAIAIGFYGVYNNDHDVLFSGMTLELPAADAAASAPC